MYQSQWRITYAVECEPDCYSAELERVGDGLGALAVIQVVDRGGRRGPPDWRVQVESCDPEVLEWLEAHEHEYAIAERLQELAAEHKASWRVCEGCDLSVPSTWTARSGRDGVRVCSRCLAAEAREDEAAHEAAPLDVVEGWR
jgi:hypothetical protein